MPKIATKTAKKPAKKPVSAKKTASKTAKPVSPRKSQLDATQWALAVAEIANKKGWKAGVLEDAAKKLGVAPALVGVVFPGGIADAVQAFNDWANEEMLSRIEENAGFSYLKIRQKIGFAVQSRFEALAPYQEAMRHLMVWSMLPPHVPQSLKHMYTLLDKMWRAAGDTSTDYNFYTKRLLLAGVQTSTLLFWLNDTSPKKAATWAFLASRIDDVLSLGQKIGQLKQLGGLAEKYFAAKRNAA